ncbi:MAG TPA: substrate-binding domain-containing protein, partial [Chitinophagaceae bacterium]
MKRELAFHDNIDFLYRHAGGNSQKQVKQIEELVKEGIDLLIVSPNEVQPLTTAVEKVFDAGIPIVLVDRRINSEKFTAFIGASNFEVGQTAARYTVSLLKGKGNVIEIVGLPTASPFTERHRGFTEIISQNKGINYLKRIDDQSPDYEKNLEHSLVTINDIDLIFAHSDYIASFVHKTCKRLGIEKKFRIIGVDGLPVDTLGMGMVANKILVATVVYPTGGQEAIINAVNILEKKPFTRETRLTTTIIDSTNVRIMMMQHEKMLAQEKDIDKRQKRIEEQIAITENQSNIIIATSISLALALIFGGILFYYLKENKKINKKLELQKEEIVRQRNQLIELMAKVKEATDAKFNFFTNISHELRTPLTLIMGPLEDTLSSPKLHFTVKNNLEFIQRNTMRLLRLINQLMDFRKIEESKMKLNASENNISAFVTEITNAFRDLA